MKWFFRILQTLLSIVFLLSGLMKVFISSEEIRTLYTETLGYSVGFMRIVGAVEALAAIGLIASFRWPKLAPVSSSILVITMAGAVVSTLVSGQGVADSVLPFMLLVIAFTILFHKRASAIGIINPDI